MTTVDEFCDFPPCCFELMGSEVVQLLLLLLIIIVLIAMLPQQATCILRIHDGATIDVEDLEGYDKEVPPFRRGIVNRVQVGIYINSFYSVDEQSMEYSINLYLRQKWVDPRLAFTRISPPTPPILRSSVPLAGGNTFSLSKNSSRSQSGSNETEEEVLKLGEAVRAKIWIPDLFFRNEKQANFHEITIPNRLVQVSSSGHVYYATRLSLTLSCPMLLHKYPLDTQNCPMQMESFGNTIDIVHLDWMEPSAVDADRHIELPQYNLQQWHLLNCTQQYSTGGVFSCLEVRFTLKRNVGYYLIQVYVPSVLVVILSWVGFWISLDAIPARVSIGLLTVLTMTTQKGAQSQTPRVSYIKAMDVWLTVCLFFVFASLLEFAIINVLSRHDKRKAQLKEAREEALRSSAVVPRGLPSTRSESTVAINLDSAAAPVVASVVKAVGRGKFNTHTRAERIDNLSRFLFPIAFGIFNFAYWSMYLVHAEEHDVSDE